jgi:hypothetical protein
MHMTYRRDRPLGYQQITSLSAAAALTIPAGTDWARITPETQAVRYRDDGTNPTATVGMPIAAGATVDILNDAAGLAAMRFIEQSASAKLNVTYYGARA